MNSTKGAHELQQEILRSEHEGLEEKGKDGQPLIHHATTAPLWSTTGTPPQSKL